MADDKDAPLTLNQVVAANIAFYRQATGITQRELGARLGLSNVSVSEAERSRDGRLHREFDAAELAALAWALRIPVIALFLPPPETDDATRFTAGDAVLDPAGLLAMLVMPDSDDDGPAMEAYRKRFGAAADRWLEPEWAAAVDRWTGDGSANPNARADQAARFRARAAVLAGYAAEDTRIADAIEGRAER